MQERVDEPNYSPVIGAVAIGRNEGERLERCLARLTSLCSHVVYVDSGSTDGSVELASSLGTDVVELDMRRPYTAGRARNAGFARLCELMSAVEYVQFVDGDCVLAGNWLDSAVEFLVANETAAIACGRRREMFPDATVYNRLCDIEWNSPIGPVEACGGDFVVRREAFDEVAGFNGQLIAGEEPELCHRLRKRGWTIYRLDAEMTMHDATIASFGQWAKRSRRSGYAYIARAIPHFFDGSRYCWRENARILFWAAFVPLTAVTLGIAASPWWLLLLLLIYPLQFLRLMCKSPKERGRLTPASFAFYTMVGNWMEFSGQVLFIYRQLTRRQQAIIEYK